MIINNMTEQSFIERFQSSKSFADNFSFEALQALYDYYDNLDYPVEFSANTICCEWGEYTEEDLKHFSYLIDSDIKEGEDKKEQLELIERELNSSTFVVKLSNTYLVQEF